MPTEQREYTHHYTATPLHRSFNQETPHTGLGFLIFGSPFIVRTGVLVTRGRVSGGLVGLWKEGKEDWFCVGMLGIRMRNMGKGER
jgi:hypothetical protein